ncbi:MAG: restriction endonuclease subunit S [Verrucomicrobia bacterium]|nr:restriction endonuclease subunit S [Verrucomicrobiota bacterium]
MRFNITRKPLGEVCGVMSGNAWPASRFNYSGNGLPVVRIQNLGKNPNADFAYWDREYSPEYLLTGGELLLSLSGSFKVELWSGPKSLLNQRIMKLTPADGLLSDYLYLLLQARIREIEAASTSTAIKNTSLTWLRSLEICYPAPAEQRRLVDRIKECLSRVEEMQRLRGEAETEARSLLAAAVRERLDPLVIANTTKPFGELVATTRLGLVRGKSEQGDSRAFAYFKMNNIARGGRVELSPMTRVDATQQEASENALAEGDFLFNTRNSAELVGKTAIVPAFPEPLLFNNNIMRVRFRDDVLSRYVNYAYQHPFVQSELDLRKSKTTNVCAVYYKSLQTLPIPFPKHRADQEVITAFLQRVETAATAMEAQFEDQEADYPALRESILREAFAGNL